MRSPSPFLVIVLSAAWLLAACGGDPPRESGTIALQAWAHAGQEAERDTLRAQVARFNREREDVRVRLRFIPEGSYDAQVQAAAVAGDLPDLLEFDGPFLYRYVWQGHLVPLEDYLPPDLVDDLLPSLLAQGRYRGRLYSVGVFDSGLALYADHARLREVGARIPDSPGDAWTLETFEGLLRDLAARDPDGAVLDLKLDYAGEWYSYAFSPLLQSAGGDLIDRETYRSASGVLNGPAAVGALRVVQSWIRAGRVDPNLDGVAFVEGRVALALGGHWNYTAYRKAYGDELLLLPLPDFGRGTRSGQGSWNWAVTRHCPHPQAAADFLAFLLQPEEVLAMSRANGAVPGTRRAVARSERFREGGPLRLFVDQLVEGYTVPRPRTPAYPVISAEFQRAFDRIRAGGDVRQALDRAARAIDREIEDNRGYPWVWEEE